MPLFWAAVLQAAPLYSAQEVLTETPDVQFQGPDRFFFKALLANTSDVPREVIYRAQLHFFDRVSPSGDLPLNILRKDGTIILDPHERKLLEIPFLSYEPPRNIAFRVEPTLRLRRQREWKY